MGKAAARPSASGTRAHKRYGENHTHIAREDVALNTSPRWPFANASRCVPAALLFLPAEMRPGRLSEAQQQTASEGKAQETGPDGNLRGGKWRHEISRQASPGDAPAPTRHWHPSRVQQPTACLLGQTATGAATTSQRPPLPQAGQGCACGRESTRHVPRGTSQTKSDQGGVKQKQLQHLFGSLFVWRFGLQIPHP